MTVGMTISEKILANAAGKKEARAGEIVEVDIDWCMTNDATTHLSIDIFEQKLNNKYIKAPDKTIFVIDHNVPSESVKTTEVQNKMRRFAREHALILYDGEGICHQILFEKHVMPGQVVVAADSHTCSYGALGAFGTGFGSTDFVGAMVTGKTWFLVPETLMFNLHGTLGKAVFPRDLILKIIGDIGSDGATYKAMEFGGSAIQDLSVEDRMVLCNLTVEAGAKTGIIAPDEVTRQFIEKNRASEKPYQFFNSDVDCVYEKTFDYDLSSIEPAVVGPDLLDNYEVVSTMAGTPISQGFIGSCNNGRIDELRIAAAILKDRQVKQGIKLLISPASKAVYLQALQEGLIEIFMQNGAILLNPNCSVCWGGCQGVLGEGEVLISTGTRNFKGRAGSPDSTIFLGSAATVAASCLEGKIVDPREYI